MNVPQADDAIASVEQLWECEIGEKTKEAWRKNLYPLDSADVAAALLKLRTQNPFERPTWDAIQAVVEDIVSRRASGKPHETPEWVQIWFWLRYKQGEQRMLPQQDPTGDIAEILPVMTAEEYGEARAQWIQEGSPKADIYGFLHAGAGLGAR